MNTETKIPELILNGKVLTNWDEVERWLIWNSPAFHKAHCEARRSQLNETEELKIAVWILAGQNQSLMQLEIERASNSCVPYIIPQVTVPKIPFWKKVIYFIWTGDFGIWKS